MIDASLIKAASDALNRRSVEIQAFISSEILSFTYSDEDIREGITPQRLQKDFQNPFKKVAIYRISVDPEIAQSVRNAFETARANKQRDYNLPRLNKYSNGNSTVYIGSSHQLHKRLHQHLHSVKSTYAVSDVSITPCLDNSMVKVGQFGFVYGH